MSSSSLIGQTLGNKYKILELLGKGGMATVYKGYQAEIDRFVAIKVLPPYPGRDSEFLERFRLEARTIARLQHPHILPVYDYGSEGDMVYLAVAYVEGGSLGDKIDSGPMSLRTVETYLREISSALDYAHRQGIVHRDIKPDNILINSEGYTLLADFGIVKLMGGDSNLTATGGLIGTPAYMAPEQAQGGEVSPAADIYALGVVAYEMITGQQPYTADTPLHVMLKHVTDPVPRISSVMNDLPVSVENVMLRVLAKDPADRYPTATAFARDLSRAISGLEVAAPPGGDQAGTLVMGGSPAETLQMGSAHTLAASSGSTPTLASPPAGGSNNTLLILGGFTIIALMVVAIVALVIFMMNQNNAAGQGVSATATSPATAAIVLPTAVPVPSLGTASFGTANAIGDTLTLQTKDLPPTSPGESYAVWLQNTESGDLMGVGVLPVNAFGEGSLSFIDPNGEFLPGLYNAIAITRESSVGDAPQGKVAFSGSYPIEIAQALRFILSTSPEGIDGGSLAQGALAEGEVGRQHSNLAASSTNIPGVLTHTEHVLNILLGTEDDYNGNGRGENPSPAKLGVGHFLDLIDTQIAAITSAPEVSLAVQNEAESINVCVINARQTMKDILAVEKRILQAADVEAAQDDLQKSTHLLDVLNDGTDFDGNGRIDPFEGECSLKQIESYGVLVGVIEIQEHTDD